jgi:drug/metabolite transporter (DMT)-like permease
MIPALLTVYLVWGSTYLALKVGVEHLPPLTVNAVRFLVAGLILYAWCAWRRRRNPDRGWRRPTRAQWRAGAIQGLLLPAAGTGGAGWAEQRLSSGTAALLLATIPLWIMIGRRVVDKEKIGPAGTLGLLAGIAGVGLLVDPFSGARPDPLSAFVALAGAMCWGLGSVYALHAPSPDQPLLASGVEMLCAGVAMGILAGFAGEYGRIELSGDTGKALLALAYLIVFGSLLAYTAYVWLLQNASPRVAGTYAFVNPVVAVALGGWLLHEPIGARALIATGIIAAGVALIVARPPKPAVSPGESGGTRESPTTPAGNRDRPAADTARGPRPAR